jgi:hypothetical protein
MNSRDRLIFPFLFGILTVFLRHCHFQNQPLLLELMKSFFVATYALSAKYYPVFIFVMILVCTLFFTVDIFWKSVFFLPILSIVVYFRRIQNYKVSFKNTCIPVFFYLFGILYSYVLELYRNVHTKDDVAFCEKISLEKKKFVK